MDIESRLARLTKNEKRYLYRRKCGWCAGRIDKNHCWAIYEKCTPETRLTRLETALAAYKPRRLDPSEYQQDHQD